MIPDHLKKIYRAAFKGFDLSLDKDKYEQLELNTYRVYIFYYWNGMPMTDTVVLRSKETK